MAESGNDKPFEVKPIDVKLRRLSKQSTVTVQIRVIETLEYKVRKWLALALVQLAIWVLGCGLEVEEES